MNQGFPWGVELNVNDIIDSDDENKENDHIGIADQSLDDTLEQTRTKKKGKKKGAGLRQDPLKKSSIKVDLNAKSFSNLKTSPLRRAFTRK